MIDTLKKITIGNKSEKQQQQQQKKKLTNVSKLFIGRDDAIKYVNDYGSMILGGKRKAAEREKPEPKKPNTKNLH